MRFTFAFVLALASAGLAAPVVEANAKTDLTERSIVCS